MLGSVMFKGVTVTIERLWVQLPAMSLLGNDFECEQVDHMHSFGIGQRMVMLCSWEITRGVAESIGLLIVGCAD